MIDQVEFWDAINEYAESCGGNTSNATISDRRMNAVTAIERLCEGAIGRAPIALKTRMEYCDRCGGYGWHEGGETIQTTCQKCGGAGLVKV